MTWNDVQNKLYQVRFLLYDACNAVSAHMAVKYFPSGNRSYVLLVNWS